MKKMMALILAMIMAFGLVACGSNGGNAEKAGDTMALTDIAAKLPEGIDEDLVSGLQTTTLEELADMVADGTDKEQAVKDLFQAKLFIEPIEGAEVVVQEPTIGSVAHMATLLRLPDGADVDAVRADIEKNADPRWMICVEAEKVNVTAHGNTILLVMSDAKTADAMTANFDALWA